MIKLIAALDKNNVIGNHNKLPWYVPEDLKRFKQVTEHQIVVMGKKTFLSLSKPLPNRLNIVLSSQVLTHNFSNVSVFKDLDSVLEMYTDFWVIGGASLYSQYIDKADLLYLTHLDQEYEGDAYFPAIPDRFKCINTEVFNKGTFKVYV